MSDPVFAGGCQCGAVRYEVQGDPVVVAICHCSMCRRANAAPAVAWAMFLDEQVRFTGTLPTQYNSSEGVQRGFCGSCGTQIDFTAEYMPGLVDLTVGSFDRPESLSPSLHCWDSQRIPWVKFEDGLPRHVGFPPFG